MEHGSYAWLEPYLTFRRYFTIIFQVDYPGESASVTTMLVALFLILFATLFRVLSPMLGVHHDWMANFSPLASIVLCGSIFFPRRMALWVPLSILFFSDVLLNTFVYHAPLFSWEILPRYFVFGLIGWASFQMRSVLRETLPLLAASLLASIVFYFVTNVASWAGDPAYTHNITGLAQSLTTGLPGFAPTYLFFRNSLVSDLLFTGLFALSMALTKKSTFVSATTTPIGAA